MEFKNIELEKLKSELNYNPLTGEFSWKGTKSGRDKKYLKGEVIVYNYKYYRKSRLAWYMYYGEYPDSSKLILKLNGIKSDYCIVNLELVDSSTLQRRLSTPKENKLKGAYYCKSLNKWKAAISIKCKVVHLGYYELEMQAHEAYLQKVRGLANA